MFRDKVLLFNGIKGCIPPMCGMQKKCRSHHIRGGKQLVKITICRKSTQGVNLAEGLTKRIEKFIKT